MNTQVTETEKYIIVRIPKVILGSKRVRRQKVDFRDIEGILKGERRFRGKTSVDIQHRAFEI